jgi:hypothetical protein
MKNNLNLIIETPTKLLREYPMKSVPRIFQTKLQRKEPILEEIIIMKFLEREKESR